MRPDAIRALPADALPQTLAAAGLAPLWAHINPTLGDFLRALHREPDLWEPHMRWDHAMPLLEALHAQGWLTCLSWVPSRDEGCKGYLELMRGPGGNSDGAYYTHENGPEMVCRAVLRTVELPEGGHHE